jgi:3-hydroxy-9,10-secoandrosta-1,3,5(10)-triene-9,17-dione monooxygenase reductase component
MSSGIERHEATEPDQELLESWLGVSMDFELRPGETLPVDGPEAARAALRFKEVLSRFASGVTVVTALVDGRPVGMTAQAFTSVSLDPPLVLFCPAKTSRAWPLMEKAGTFCVNLLAHDQAELSEKMAARGTDKFDQVSWTPSPVTGSPKLDGILGHVDCSVYAVHEAGDHYIVVGRVLDLDASDVPHALLYFQGQYGSTDQS